MISYAVEDTMNFAAEMSKSAKAGDVICLCGQLGAGKTAFAKGYARGLGVMVHVNSPTFTLLQVYEDGRLPLYHFDLYRLMDGNVDEDTLEDIGFFEYLDGSGVCLIEWAECARDMVPAGACWIEIGRSSKDGDVENERTIHIR